ncbi:MULTISPECIES: LuxR C-terminal-related transcriptional regulator [Streptomyces]|nr:MULTISPECIES: LuxR C-terminal-related transcriptional regulator [Streptomyces]
MVTSSNRFHGPKDAGWGGFTASRVLMILEEPELGSEADLFSDHPADSYLMRTGLTVESLGQALSQVVSGQMLMPLSVGRMLMSRAVESPAPTATLTSRETGVLQLLAEGLSNKQIGKRLDISEHGAKRLVGSVLAKLNTPNRTSAVVLAIKAGLL